MEEGRLCGMEVVVDTTMKDLLGKEVATVRGTRYWSCVPCPVFVGCITSAKGPVVDSSSARCGICLKAPPVGWNLMS